MGFSRQEYLEWVARPSSRGSSRPRDGTRIFYFSCISKWFFTTSATWEAHESQVASTSYLQSGWEAQENGLASTSYLQGGWGRGLLLTFHRLDSSGCFKRCLGKSKARAWCRDLKLRSISKCPDSGCKQGYPIVKCLGHSSKMVFSSQSKLLISNLFLYFSLPLFYLPLPLLRTPVIIYTLQTRILSVL